MSLNKNIYKRFTSGKYSQKDYLAIKDSINNPDHKFNTYLKEDWDQSLQNKEEDKNLYHILFKIQQEIHSESIGNRGSLLKNIWRSYSKLAAIFLIPLMLAIPTYLIITNQEKEAGITYTEIHAPLGTRTKFELPDGSSGWLNSGSVLKFSQPFVNDRKLSLTGEAYFDVKHLDGSDFKVAFADLYVNVLGTKFNVMAYNDEDIAEVILEQGSIEILNEEEKLISNVEPNQKFTLNKRLKSASIEQIDANSYTSWKDGKLMFRNEPIINVVKRLGRWYNVDFVLADDQLLDINYRATFVNEQLEEVLKLLSYSTPIRYEIENRKMNDDHEFLKRKVILRLDKHN